MNRQTSRRHEYHTRVSKKLLQTKMPWCYKRMSSNEGPVFTLDDTRGSISRGRSDCISIDVVRVRIVRIIAIGRIDGTTQGFRTIYFSEVNFRTNRFGMRRHSGLGFLAQPRVIGNPNSEDKKFGVD